MKQSVKKKWLKALRSGQYKQITGQLRGDTYPGSNQQGFCCLGVLCNIHAQEHPKIAKLQRYSYSYMGESALLPLEVVKWAGLEDEDPLVTYAREAKHLSDLNDDWLSFKQIANVIERRL